MSDSGPMADVVVYWQSLNGRHSLPWQNTRNPYRVWLSEIMLQQTQVATVMRYYVRFLDRFPDVYELARASQDEVLALWSGLGYYSRARNLHKAAQQVVDVFSGEFPHTAEELAKLPGIGRSTAAAIAAFCFCERVPILDANVRRVLTRLLGFAQDLARPENERVLWSIASGLVPTCGADMPAYTQGMMDLGAGICLPSRPLCLLCPLASRCVAHAAGNPERYPVRTRKIKKITEIWWLLWLSDPSQRVWLEPRPVPGIWAGLQCLPIFKAEERLQEHLAKIGGEGAKALPVVRHALTHRNLVLQTIQAQVSADFFSDNANGKWCSMQEAASLGLPAPIRVLLTGGSLNTN